MLKSIFISIYLMALTVSTLHVISQLLYGTNTLFWFGNALALMPGLLFFVFLVLAPRARTSANLNTVLLATICGAVISGFSIDAAEQSFWFYTYACGVGIGGLLLYIYWYSVLERRNDQVLVAGQNLPSFSLSDTEGGIWDSSESTSYPALMLFFRGNWCPLCMAQIKEIAALYKDLEQKGVQILLVSPQPEKQTQALARKYQLGFRFLIDRDGKVAKMLGIDAPAGTPAGLQVMGYESDTVLPTVVAIDQSGKIIWLDQTDNYRVRPEPQVFLKVFENHGISA